MYFLHSHRDLGNHKDLCKCVFHYITISCLYLQTPTPTIFAMNPTENNLACSFHCMTVWLAPCHTFRMHPKWNSICTLPVALGEAGNTGLPTLRGVQQGSTQLGKGEVNEFFWGLNSPKIKRKEKGKSTLSQEAYMSLSHLMFPIAVRGG